MSTIKLYRFQPSGVDNLVRFMYQSGYSYLETLEWDSKHPSIQDLYPLSKVKKGFCAVNQMYIGHWFNPTVITELYKDQHSLYEVAVNDDGLLFDYSGQTLVHSEQVLTIKELTRDEVPVTENDDDVIDHRLERFITMTLSMLACRKRRETNDPSLEAATLVNVGLPLALINRDVDWDSKRESLLVSNGLPVDVTLPYEDMWG